MSLIEISFKIIRIVYKVFVIIRHHIPKAVFQAFNGQKKRTNNEIKLYKINIIIEYFKYLKL